MPPSLALQQIFTDSQIIGSQQPAKMVILFDGIRDSFASFRVCRVSESPDECDEESGKVILSCSSVRFRNFIAVGKICLMMRGGAARLY